MSAALKGFLAPINVKSTTPKTESMSVRPKSLLNMHNSMKAEDTLDFTIKSENRPTISHSMKNPEFTIS